MQPASTDGERIAIEDETLEVIATPYIRASMLLPHRGQASFLRRHGSRRGGRHAIFRRTDRCATTSLRLHPSLTQQPKNASFGHTAPTRTRLRR